MTPVSNSMLSAADETEALEQLHRDRCTDGLPVIVPTRERVERMVLAGGLDEGDASVAASDQARGQVGRVDFASYL